jgi:hypothetical protein
VRALLLGGGVLAVAGLSAGATWLLVRQSPLETKPGSAADAGLRPAANATRPTRALAGAPKTCAEVTVCCWKIAARTGGAPGNCDGFLQLADQACVQPLASYRATAEKVGLRCD